MTSGCIKDTNIYKVYVKKNKQNKFKKIKP